MSETDFEKERRALKELEGKNVANYRVLLTALIRTTMENVRTMVILSAAGIGLVVFVLMLGKACCGGRLVVAAGAFIGFFVSLILNLGVLERNARYLAQSFKGGSDQSLDLENCSRGGRQLFFLGCICLIALGLLPMAGMKYHQYGMMKKECPLGWHMSKKETEAETMATAPAEMVKSSSKEVQPISMAVSQDSTKASVTKIPASVSTKVSSTEPVQKAYKTTGNSGNSGNFKGGSVY